MHGKSHSITTDPNITTNSIDGLCDANQGNSGNFMPRLKFSENFDHAFSHVFLFGTVSESHGFVAMQFTICIKDTCSNLSRYN